MEDDAKDYTEGKLVLVFMPQTERGKSPKLSYGWSMPFKIIRRISPVVFELTSLNWSIRPITIVRALSSIKIYTGRTDFSNEAKYYDKRRFYGGHEFDIITDDEQETEKTLETINQYRIHKKEYVYQVVVGSGETKY